MTALDEMSRMRKTALLVALALLLSVAPLAAQDNPTTAVDWVPATFDSLIRVNLAANAADGTTALDSLNVAAYIVSKLQPARLSFNQRLGYGDFFPLDILDTEDVTFESNVLPWVRDSIVLAYRNFGPTLKVADSDMLMVLPASDTFAAASFLSAIIKSQDFPKHDSYHETSLYIGDRATIGLTPDAVLIGSEADVRAAVDAESGAAARLIDTPAFKTVSAALPADGVLFAYVDGRQSLRAVSVLLNGSDSGMGLLSALGGVMKSAQAAALETQLLTGAVKGIGLSMAVNNLKRTLHAQAAIYADSAPTGKLDPSILQLVPRSALLVQSGADARAAFEAALRLMPLSDYVTQFLGGFIPPSPNAPPAPPVPTSAEMQSAVDGFVGALKGVGSFDLDAGLSAHLGGSYLLAVIPRPNNPTPLTGAPFDVLIAAQVSDGAAAVTGAGTLAQIAFGLPAARFQPATVEGAPFNRAVVPATGETLFSVGSVDNLLVLGTGDAADEAMRARNGDNQLVKVDRWQAVTGDSPLLYVDLNAVYNLLLPSAGAASPSGIGQLGIDIRDGGSGVTIFDALANIPT